jgi:hypothetical protein
VAHDQAGERDTPIDPVFQLRIALRERLDDLAPFSSAVSFARLGKKGE